MYMQLEAPTLSAGNALIGLGLVVLAVAIAGMAHQERFDWVFWLNVALFVYFLVVLLVSPGS